MPNLPATRERVTSAISARYADLARSRVRRRPDGSLRLLPSRLQLVGPFVVVLPLVFIFSIDLSRPHTNDDFGFFLPVFAVMVVPSLLSAFFRCVELGPTQLRYRNFVRWHELDAAEIQAVTLSDVSLTEYVRVWDTGRVPHRLMTVTGVDLATVGDWWVERRGADWRPAWGPPPPPAPPQPMHWDALPDNPWQP